MASECNEYIDNITFGIPPYRLLFYINPVDTPIWEPRDKIWDRVFLSYSVVFATLNFLLGLLAVFLIIKRKCIRLKTKTFFAVYTCLAILGFSRALYLAIDPYGVIGWMIDYFPQWTIISRFLSILGFPSLTASYSLVFIPSLTASYSLVLQAVCFFLRWIDHLSYNATIYETIHLAMVYAISWLNRSQFQAWI